MSVYSVNDEPTIASGREETKHVFCNGSDVATGGGWALFPGTDMTVKASYPHSNGLGWTVVFRNESAGATPVDLYVICAELG